jgi:hypothetical protein
MAKCFVTHTNVETIKEQEAQYLIHLLEAFKNLTLTDAGIESISNFGVCEAIANILKHHRDVISGKLEDSY